MRKILLIISILFSLLQITLFAQEIRDCHGNNPIDEGTSNCISGKIFELFKSNGVDTLSNTGMGKSHQIEDLIHYNDTIKSIYLYQANGNFRKRNLNKISRINSFGEVKKIELIESLEVENGCVAIFDRSRLMAILFFKSFIVVERINIERGKVIDYSIRLPSDSCDSIIEITYSFDHPLDEMIVYYESAGFASDHITLSFNDGTIDEIILVPGLKTMNFLFAECDEMIEIWKIQKFIVKMDPGEAPKITYKGNI